jgi:ATP-dependent DNA ligase
MVRIEEVPAGRRLAHVGLGLTEAEAAELRDTLDTLLGDRAGRHEHVSSADFQTGLTVWIEPADR